MNSSPLFSVLVASYNNERYIIQAIQSIFAQTYKNWEIIIVDDCSTDGSLKLLEQYQGLANIKIEKNDKNYGCGYTKRRCVQLATGELCGFLDPDDELLPDALEAMVAAHAKHPECSLIGSLCYICDAKLRPISATKQTIIPQGYSYLSYKNHSPNHFASFKKHLYNKTEGLGQECMRAVDQDLYFKLEEVGQLLFLDKLLYKYRVHRKSISNSKTGHGKALFWHVVLIYQAYKRRQLDMKEAEQLAEWFITRPYRSYKYRTGNLLLSPIEVFVQSVRLAWRRLFKKSIRTHA